MNILILNASPKEKGGASRFFSSLLRLMLFGCNITTCDVRRRSDYERALSLLADVDTVIISSPLYVDGIPAHMLPFLIAAEQECIEKQYHFNLYVLSNSGFVEGKQNALHLKMYEAWCAHTDIEWGGGLGIGGGVMLHVLYIIFPISIIIRCANIMLIAYQTDTSTAFTTWSNWVGLLVTPFFFIGAFVCEAIISYAIRHKIHIKNIYTRPFVPSFLFLIMADIFMLLSAVLKGTWPHHLFKRINSPPLENEH